MGFRTLFALPPAFAAEESTRLSAEVLWQLQRAGSPVMSPDGAKVVVSVKTYPEDGGDTISRLWLLTVDGDAARRPLNQSAVYPARIVRLDTERGSVRRLDTFNDGVLSDVSIGTNESATYTGADGDPIQMWVHYRESPEIYRAISPHLYADRFDTPSLIIHGQNDLRVPVGQAFEL